MKKKSKCKDYEKAYTRYETSQLMKILEIAEDDFSPNSARLRIIKTILAESLYVTENDPSMLKPIILAQLSSAQITIASLRLKGSINPFEATAIEKFIGKMAMLVDRNLK